MKYYFQYPDSENCYLKSHFIEEMEDSNITEMQVFPAKMIKGELVAFCTELGDVIETQRGDCGKWCDSYEPRNGKSGRCTFSNNCYEASEKPITIRSCLNI